MRVVIAEALTQALLDRHSGLIANADACWAVRAPEWPVARDALNDPRWRTGDYPLFDAAAKELGLWAYAVADTLSHSDRPLSAAERALLAYGLQVRLIGPASARAFVDQLTRESGTSSREMRITVIASDPYLRAAFSVARWPSVELLADPTKSLVAERLRERAVRSRWLRTLQLLGAAASTNLREKVSPRDVALFLGDQTYADLSAPIQRWLDSRGRRTTVFAYVPLSAPPLAEVIPFDAAARRVSRSIVLPAPRRVAAHPSELTGAAPVSDRAAAFAIAASWNTALAQIERHRRVLRSYRPKVVASYGPDTMSLALQAAAAELGIPSVFLPHGFLGPYPLVWTLPATATAVPGSGCVDDNSVNALGERNTGLVVTGYPNYDAILSAADASASADISRLRIPSSRPFRVVLFVEWGMNLLDHAIHRRTLTIAARSLPPDAFLICKLHPGHDHEHERSADVLNAVLSRDAFRVVRSDEYPTPALLRVCDVAIAEEASMALIDAVVAGVPAIGIRHVERPFGSLALNYSAADHVANGIVTVVEDEDGAFRAMTALTRNRDARTQALAGRTTYIERFLFAADGRSSERVADLIDHLGSGNGLASFTPVREMTRGISG